MNLVIYKGRLTADPEVKVSGENTVTRFTVALDRQSKDGGADFPSCVAFGKNADNIGKYFGKGSMILLTGHINTGSYTRQDGTKVYTTDTIVDRWEFCTDGKAKEKEEQPTELPEADINGFMQIPEGFQEELPFN